MAAKQSQPTDSASPPATDAQGAPVLAAAQNQLESVAKAMMDRHAAMTAMMMEVSRDNLDTMIELSQTAGNGFREMAMQFGEFSRQRLEDAKAVGQAMGDVKAPVDLVHLHADHSKRLSATVANEVQALADMTSTMTLAMMATLQSRSRRTQERLQSISASMAPATDTSAGAQRP